MDPPSPDELHRLARKYRTLGELRRARARGEGIPERSVFRALAGEFPGALYELDRLPLDLIDERHQALVRAAEGGELELWMGWMQRYHALMRAALRIKPRTVRHRVVAIPSDRAEALARDATAHAGVDVDATFVRAVAHPPGGRIGSVVYARLSELSGVPPEAIREELFPRPGASRRPAL
jgi:hypothetical protein